MNPEPLEQHEDPASSREEELEEVPLHHSQLSNFGQLTVHFEDYVMRAQGARMAEGRDVRFSSPAWLVSYVIPFTGMHRVWNRVNPPLKSQECSKSPASRSGRRVKKISHLFQKFKTK